MAFYSPLPEKSLLNETWGQNEAQCMFSKHISAAQSFQWKLRVNKFLKIMLSRSRLHIQIKNDGIFENVFTTSCSPEIEGAMFQTLQCVLSE